jgi:hypothetical protein
VESGISGNPPISGNIISKGADYSSGMIEFNYISDEAHITYDRHCMKIMGLISWRHIRN